MSETEIEDENILGHFQEILQRASGSKQDRAMYAELDSSQVKDVEYACLRSMMLEPQNAAMWNALALVYMMSRYPEEAEDAIERSLDIDTSNSWTWSIWGDLLRQEGRIIESVRAYRMAVELNPQNEQALRQLVFYYDAKKASPEVLSLLEKLIPISPKDQVLWDIYSDCLRRSKNRGR
ncbi:MAG: tetratricopeptide repeat protein [Candidatus Thorarchaeota archaeon]